MTNAEKAYRDFLSTIDASVAGSDEHGDLIWHVECSAEANAGDTMNETGGEWGSDEYWDVALRTAQMCADDWRGCYPQLRLRPRPIIVERGILRK
jgi:hypothetical protein